MATQRKYNDGDFVLIGYPSPHLKVMVESAVECLKGWKYRLRYLRKDKKSIDKRTAPIHLFDNKILPT